MKQLLQHTLNPRRARTPRARDLSGFAPTTPIARRQIDELVSRGAVVVHVRPTLVVLRRAGQTVRVDALGRVEWAS